MSRLGSTTYGASPFSRNSRTHTGSALPGWVNPKFRLSGFEPGETGVEGFPSYESPNCWCGAHAPDWDGTEEADVLVHARDRGNFLAEATAYEQRTGQRIHAALYLPNGEEELDEDSENFDAIVRRGEAERLWRFRDGEFRIQAPKSAGQGLLSAVKTALGRKQGRLPVYQHSIRWGAGGGLLRDDHPAHNHGRRTYR